MSTKKYNGGKYEFLFSRPIENLQNANSNLNHKDVFRYRVRTIVCGDTTEVEMFPIWRDYSQSRTAKAATTREAQKKLNERNAKKTLIRLINTNFTKDDYHITLTYSGDKLPDEKQAIKDMQNFIKRVRYHHKKNGFLDKYGKLDLKYIYVIEFSDGDGRRKRVHHHLIMNSRMTRNAIKVLWVHGRAGVDELEPENGSLEGLARYITKQKLSGKNSKRWQASRNLKPYTKKTESDYKLSKRQVETLATDIITSAPAILSKSYPNHTLDSCTIKSSEFVAGAYVYAKLYKTRK